MKWVNGHTPRCLAGGGELDHRLAAGAGRVEGHERLAGLAVAHQLDRPEHAEPAHLADATDGVRRCRAAPGPMTSSPRCAGVLDDALVLEDVDAATADGTGERVARVGEAARVDAVVERVGDAAG